MLRRQSAIAFVIVAFAGVGSAQTSSPSKKGPGAQERVCETIVLTGSRLASKRFCGTRYEWEDRRRQDREAVEKAQTQLCVAKPGGKC